jgi:hypothetical protein
MKEKTNYQRNTKKMKLYMQTKKNMIAFPIIIEIKA